MESLTALDVAHFVLNRLRERFGPNFTGSRRPHAPRRKPEERALLDPLTLLRDYQLLNVRGDQHAGLLHWLEGRYALEARPDIPSPDEVLDLQCSGRRCVTVMRGVADQTRRFGRFDGALAFLLHDLEHAHKFFGDPDLARGQRRFFNLLRDTLPKLSGFDAAFAEQLDYVKSDMNSHPLHMLKYLKAILLNALKRQRRAAEFEPFCADVFAAWHLPRSSTGSTNRVRNARAIRPRSRHFLSDFDLGPQK